MRGCRREENRRWGGRKGLQTGKWERWVLSGRAHVRRSARKEKIQTRALSLRLGLTVLSAVCLRVRVCSVRSASSASRFSVVSVRIHQ